MFILRSIYIVIIMGLLSGCQHNNLPLPATRGVFTTLEAPPVAAPKGISSTHQKTNTASISTARTVKAQPIANKPTIHVKTRKNHNSQQQMEELTTKDAEIAALEKKNKALKKSLVALNKKVNSLTNPASNATPKTEADRKSFAGGKEVGKSFRKQLLTTQKLNVPFFLEGVHVGLDDKKGDVVEAVSNGKKAIGNKEIASVTVTPVESAVQEGKTLVAKISKDKRYTLLNNGVYFRVIHKGKGKVSAGQYVSSRIKESLANGKVITDMEKSNTLYTELIEKYSPLFRDVIQTHLGVGGEAEVVIPPELAYGKEGRGSEVPPNSTMVFKIKIMDVS